MVHPVIRRRTKPAVKPAQLAHVFGMHPELVEQIDERDDAEDERRDANDGHGQVKNPSNRHARGGLPQSGRQVVVIALVMHHMTAPEQGHFVAGAVVPVIAKIVEHQGDDHAIPAVPKVGLRKQRHLFEHQGVNADAQQSGEHRAQLADDPEADAVDSIVPAVGLRRRLTLARQTPTPPAFECDGQQKNRCRQHNDETHAASFQ